MKNGKYMRLCAWMFCFEQHHNDRYRVVCILSVLRGWVKSSTEVHRKFEWLRIKVTMQYFIRRSETWISIPEKCIMNISQIKTQPENQFGQINYMIIKNMKSDFARTEQKFKFMMHIREMNIQVSLLRIRYCIFALALSHSFVNS